MINNLLPLLSYENIYLVANWGVIPFWLLLIILPNHSLTNFFIQSIIIPLILAGAYSFVAYNIYLEGNILDTFELYSGLEGLYSMFSNEGFLYVIEKNKGNIIRVTNLFKNYKLKKRKNIYPIGFAIGNKNLYLTNSDGKMIVVDLQNSSILKTDKVSSKLVSKPFIFNNNLFLVRNGSIVQYN